MVFARALGRALDHAGRGRRGAPSRDISVFPLAFPLIAGPGAIATILLAFAGVPFGSLQFFAQVGSDRAGARDHAGADADDRPGDARRSASPAARCWAGCSASCSPRSPRSSCSTESGALWLPEASRSQTLVPESLPRLSNRVAADCPGAARSPRRTRSRASRSAPTTVRASAPRSSASRSRAGIATRLELARHQLDECRLHDAALVVTLLRPRVREVEQHSSSDGVRHAAGAEHLAPRRGSDPHVAAASSDSARSIRWPTPGGCTSMPRKSCVRHAPARARRATRRCRSRFRASRGASRPKARARSSGSSPSLRCRSAGHSSRQARSCAVVMRPARATKLRIARRCDVRVRVAAARRQVVSGIAAGKVGRVRDQGDCRRIIKRRPARQGERRWPAAAELLASLGANAQASVPAHVVGVPGRRHRQRDLRRVRVHEPR